MFSPRKGGFPRALGNGCVLEGGEWEARGLKRTKQGAKPWLGSAASGGWGRGCGGTDPAFLRDGHGGREGPFPRTVRVQGRSWKRGWCIIVRCQRISGGFPCPPPPSLFHLHCQPCRRMSRPPRTAGKISQEVWFKGNPGTFSKSEQCKVVLFLFALGLSSPPLFFVSVVLVWF